jgi:hypothetical protein
MSPRHAQRNIRPPCSARTPATVTRSSRAPFARVQPEPPPSVRWRDVARRQVPDGLLRTGPADRYVGSPRNNGPGLLIELVKGAVRVPKRP